MWLCPSLPTETLKWHSSLPILMQESFWWWQCSDRYIISLFPHLHTPFPISPSLISLMVSVDVKHHVYLEHGPVSIHFVVRLCPLFDTRTSLHNIYWYIHVAVHIGPWFHMQADTPVTSSFSVRRSAWWCLKIQTHKMFKRTLFIRTKHNIRIFGVIPFIKLQNDT